jgi:6-phospho-beta-glucosidase
LLDELGIRYCAHDIQGMQDTYKAYLSERGNTYMVKETGKVHDFSNLDRDLTEPLLDEGYAGVALNLIEGLIGNRQFLLILNVPNHGSIAGMEELDVVEIPAIVNRDDVVPISIGNIPNHCFGLIKQVKYYERLTIEAAVEKSIKKARLALTLHPLIRDFSLATQILHEYMMQHRGYFPELH